jgi:hypothetical protein
MVAIPVPGHVDAAINPSGDTDSYRVYLHNGDSYDFDVIGHANGDHDSISPGVFDPTLTLSYHGNQVAYNDDANYPSNLDSHIDYTANHSGWYTLTVAGYSNEHGGYSLYADHNDGLLAV